MRFSADCSFHIGAQHLRSGLACQDYALAEADPFRGRAVVSDGCSSGGKTDVGARIIAHAARQAWNEGAPISLTMKLAMTSLGLEESDLLATCLRLEVECINGEAKAFVRIYGDGAAAFVRRDGTIRMVRAEWANNAPSYPVYGWDGYRRFIEAQGGPVAEGFTIVNYEFGHEAVASYPNAAVADGIMVKFDGQLHAAAVFSDGVCQVDGMSWQEVVRELMAFKSTTGDFVKRRMNRFLRDAAERGKGPIDDISMAAISFEDET